MGWFYRAVVRPLLFSYDSEDIHDRTLGALSKLSEIPLAPECLGQFFGSEELPTTCFSLKFPNPVGLAAGMDKQGAAVPIWERLGFGFCELGGVTRYSQPGNPAPRMFRSPEHQALINRMGFNNPGALQMAENLASWQQKNLWPMHPVGINLGKSKVTPLSEAAGDYLASFRALRNTADFFVVNVSSPNTPQLRELQDKSALDEILAAIQNENRVAPQKPVLVKMAPDLSFEAIDQMLEVVLQRSISGVVATNTTIERPAGSSSPKTSVLAETGGLSGKPLQKRSTEIIRHLYRSTRGAVPIIGVGGIFTGEDAWEKITAGASLVQIYTGLVYEGPAIASQIVQTVRKKMQQAGFKNISEAVGTEAVDGGH